MKQIKESSQKPLSLPITGQIGCSKLIFESSLLSPHYPTTNSSFRHIFFCGQSYFKTRENEVKENTSTRQLNSFPPTKANA